MSVILNHLFNKNILGHTNNYFITLDDLLKLLLTLLTLYKIWHHVFALYTTEGSLFPYSTKKTTKLIVSRVG